MEFINWIKKFFTYERDIIPSVQIVKDDVFDDPEQLEQEIQKLDKDIAKFQVQNVVLEKLNYLEEYIKSFATSFPNEYKRFAELINTHRKDYEQQLDSYRKGLAGNITVAIDPECDNHYLALLSLEGKIDHFVDFVVCFETHKKKFVTLCSRLNEFYNTVVNCHVDDQKVYKQFLNASEKARELIAEVQPLNFFAKDSRRREEILNYVIYCDYMLFKIALRYNFCDDLTSYKDNTSKLFAFFVESDYDKLMFKFLVQDLEQVENFVTSKLKNYECYNFLLQSCEKLKSQTREFLHSNLNATYFDCLLKLENTLEEAAKTVKQDFIVLMPSIFGTPKVAHNTDVNKMAISVLKLINKNNSKILLSLISDFTIDITWEEFYFLCKIFDVYDSVVSVAKSTVFSCIYDNFASLDNKYPEYSAEYIMKYKMRLLNYKGTQKKKYILLFRAGQVDTAVVTTELMNLYLDFVVIDDAIYLHHSYFNGFSNLEAMFVNHITI